MEWMGELQGGSEKMSAGSSGKIVDIFENVWNCLKLSQICDKIFLFLHSSRSIDLIFIYFLLPTKATCTKSCGLGETLRIRSVVKHPERGGGRCPNLKEVKWCGSARACRENENYFKWWFNIVVDFCMWFLEIKL
jgi:hypothetical protein